MHVDVQLRIRFLALLSWSDGSRRFARGVLVKGTVSSESILSLTKWKTPFATDKTRDGFFDEQQFRFECGARTILPDYLNGLLIRRVEGEAPQASR